MKDCITTVSFVQPTIKPLVLQTQEPSDESDKDSNTDSLPTIFKEDIKGSIVEENANEKCNMVEKLNMKNKEQALEKIHDVVGKIFVVKSNRCFFNTS